MLRVEFDRETDGRWIAEVIDLPGVMAYGATRAEALAIVEALAAIVIADRIVPTRDS
jgi:predicted RNase H-like HicB family nuclease